MNEFLLAVLCLLVASEVVLLWRVLKAPTMLDRLTAAAMATNILTFVLAVAGALKASELYYEAALVAALLSVGNTIILAKLVATGRVL